MSNRMVGSLKLGNINLPVNLLLCKEAIEKLVSTMWAWIEYYQQDKRLWYWNTECIDALSGSQTEGLVMYLDHANVSKSFFFSLQVVLPKKNIPDN